MGSKSKGVHVLGAASLIALVIANGPAYAQTAGNADAVPPAEGVAPAATGVTESTNDEGLEEIIVTARLRSENLQDVPAAITALSGEAIETAHITSIAELGSGIPNVALERLPTGGGTIKASIRGISFGDNRLTFEPVVGVVLDNIFLGTSAGSNLDPFDIESIQVLRGPQGTLFGRNTVAGAIVVTRNKPTGEFGGSFDLRYGSYNLLEQRAVLNLPKAGAFSAKIFAMNADQDSFARNLSDGKRDKYFSHFYVGGALLFEPSDDFDALLRLDHSKLRDNPNVINLTPENGFLFCDNFTQTVYANTPFANNGCRSTGYDVAAAADFKVTPQVFPSYARTETYSAGLQMNWNPSGGDVEVKSITGVVDIAQIDGGQITGDLGIPAGPGGSLIPLSDYGQDTDFKQFSQEFRVEASPFEGLRTIGGLFYFHSKFDSGPVTLLNGVTGNQNTRSVLANSRVFGQTLNSYAVFADGTYDISDRIHLSAGARYTLDKKDFFTDIRVGATEPGGMLQAGGKKDWSRVTGRAALNYDFSDDATVYGSWSRGFRSGGFNSRANSLFQVQIPFDPETVDSYELGLRTEWFERRLRFNPTIFFSQYKDRQETIFVPTGTGFFSNVVDNTGEQEFKGIELEVMARVSDSLRLTASGGYTDAEITKLETLNTTTGQVIDIANQRQVVFAPKYTYSIAADYRVPVGDDNEIRLNAAYSYRAWMYTDPLIASDATKDRRSPTFLNVIPSVRSADFTLTYHHALTGDRAVEISAYVKDAFDKARARLDHSQVIAGTFAYGQLTPTRQFGLEAKFDF